LLLFGLVKIHLAWRSWPALSGAKGSSPRISANKRQNPSFPSITAVADTTPGRGNQAFVLGQLGFFNPFSLLKEQNILTFAYKDKKNDTK
jgi:hypothetical protein